MCNNNPNNASIINSCQSSPAANSSPSHGILKKRILNAFKQVPQDEQQNNQAIPEYSPLTDQPSVEQDKTLSRENSSEDAASLILKPSSEANNQVIETSKKTTSGFLITSPTSSAQITSSSSASSSSTSSTNTHFNYDIPTTNSSKSSDTNVTNNNTNTSSFQWPSQISQFRRQTLHTGSQTPNVLPTTPYTPPPMLSPFRKGPGLYYHVFSQTTPVPPPTTTAVPTVPTPVLPYTPIPDEISGPKINIGEQYQAPIPKLRTKIASDDTGLLTVNFLSLSYSFIFK